MLPIGQCIKIKPNIIQITLNVGYKKGDLSLPYDKLLSGNLHYPVLVQG